LFLLRNLVLQLIHENGHSGFTVPVLPEGENEDVQVWREPDGTLIAHGYSAAGRHWMRVPHVGSFAFGRSGTENGDNDGPVHVFAEPTARTEWILDTFHRMVLPMALQAQGREVLHASAVQTPRGIVALCAVSETGKSTLAYALSRRGFPLWADDAVVFRINGDSEVGEPVTATPVPFAIRLRPASAAYFDPQQAEPIPARAAAAPAEPTPLAAVCILERKTDGGPGPAVEVRRLSPAQAFPAVLTHAYCFSLRDEARKRCMLRHYLDFSVRVPVFRVRFPAGLERIPEILDRLVESVEAAKRDAGPTPQ
jgi:hypothetical protein